MLDRVSAISQQIEGRGNGIKTNVVNNVDIAKALDRPPECEFSHYLGLMWTAVEVAWMVGMACVSVMSKFVAQICSL